MVDTSLQKKCNSYSLHCTFCMSSKIDRSYASTAKSVLWILLHVHTQVSNQQVTYNLICNRGCILENDSISKQWTPCNRIHLKKLYSALPFTEPTSSVPFSQAHTTVTYPLPAKSSSYPNIHMLHMMSHQLLAQCSRQRTTLSVSNAYRNHSHPPSISAHQGHAMPWCNMAHWEHYL